MKNMLMYMFCSLAWGLNFLVIKLQGDYVPLEVSLFYRLLFASIVFFVVALVVKNRIAFDKNHLYLFMFGGFNFCFSYLLLYYATQYVSSMFVAIIFSFKTIFTPICLSIFLKQRLDENVIFGGVISIIGILILLYPRLCVVFDTNFLFGFFIALLGTLITSLGDVCSARNNKHSIHPITANAFGFFYATLILIAYIQLTNIGFTFDISLTYIISIAYLTLFASIFAWLFYLTLVKNIGAAKSSYMVALFPMIATVASILIGEVRLDFYIFIGSLICTIGALVALNALYIMRRIVAS